MKKAIFFLAILLSAPTWVSPASAGSLPPELAVVAADEAAAPRLCTITFKGTYDGKEINLTVTVEADNCATAAADFLKRWAQR